MKLLHSFINGLQSKRGITGWMDGWKNTHKTVLYQSTCGANINKITNRRENPVGKRAALPGPQVVFHLTRCQILLKDLAGCICKNFDTSHNAQKNRVFHFEMNSFQIISQRQNLVLFKIWYSLIDYSALTMIIMMRVKIVLVSVSKNSENEDDAKIVRDKKIDFCFAVSDSELNLSETILEPSRAQVMLLNFVNEDSCVSVFWQRRRIWFCFFVNQGSWSWYTMSRSQVSRTRGLTQKHKQRCEE